MPNPYEVLGVREDATCREIKDAFWARARALQSGAAPEGARLAEVVSSYRLLSQPGHRAAVDRSLREARKRRQP